MKAALFSKLSILPYLVVAGLSGCGDSGDNGSGPACQDLTAQPCTCATGAPGFQLCQNGQYGVCTCGGMNVAGNGNAGFPNAGAPPIGGAPPGGAPPGNAVCGDGLISGGEQCDGQNQGNQTCATVSMGACTGGYLICTAQCLFDYTACVCGAGGQGGGGGMGPGGTTGFGGSGGTTGQP